MMSNNLTDIISEVDRLLALSMEQRENEGVYADTSQLKFLHKNLKSSISRPSILNGVARFVSDLASSDSKILSLLDKLMENGDA